MSETLDEWVAKNKFQLALDIACHIKEIVKEPDDVELLLRWIMISVREDATRTEELHKKEAEELESLAYEVAKKRGW
jgi:hypothetical protein